MEIKDKVWIKEEEKWKACKEFLQQDRNTFVVVWFEENYHKLKAFLALEALPTHNLLYTRQLTTFHGPKSNIIFAEHFPLTTKETALFERLRLSTATIYSSLDEPVFKMFGGEKISKTMLHLGLKEDESIEHPFITSTLQNAQNKISENLLLEQSATSQADWLMKNLTT